MGVTVTMLMGAGLVALWMHELSLKDYDFSSFPERLAVQESNCFVSLVRFHVYTSSVDKTTIWLEHRLTLEPEALLTGGNASVAVEDAWIQSWLARVDITGWSAAAVQRQEETWARQFWHHSRPCVLWKESEAGPWHALLRSGWYPHWYEAAPALVLSLFYVGGVVLLVSAGLRSMLTACEFSSVSADTHTSTGHRTPGSGDPTQDPLLRASGGDCHVVSIEVFSSSSSSSAPMPFSRGLPSAPLYPLIARAS